MIGKQLSNRYRIEAEIGRGGMGVIYRAHDLLLGRDVAVKLLENQGTQPERRDTRRSQLLREARAAAQLNHAHIVGVYDVIVFGEQDESTYIIMELLEGPNLHDRPPATLEESLAVTSQVCSALEHAHRQGIIHRDLKPENILWTGPNVKLSDFGLARSLSTRISMEGTIAGSVFYMAPEQALGKEVDARADLYALGVILYELAAGRLPFTADDPIAVISQHLYAPVVPPSTYQPNLPQALEELILRLLSKRPEDRPASAAEVLAALNRLRAGEPQPESQFLPELAGPLQSAEKPLKESLLERIARGRMIGRSAEFQDLRLRWSLASQGQAQLVLLSGEPGVGKTRLANEFTAYARLQGAAVLQGGCYEYEAAIPYLPLSEALGEWASAQPEAPLRERLGSLAAELSRLAPVIEARLGPQIPNPTIPPEEERLRLFDHVARFLQRLASENGLLLFIDDLHWADRGTLSLLHYLLRRLRGERILLLAAYREIELDRSHPLGSALAEWSRERLASMTRLPLGRLRLEDCQALLAVLFGQQEISLDFALAIYRETEGNPFFIEETIKALIEAGQIYRRDGAWERREIEELAIPQSIKEAVGRRLDGLDSQTCEVLHHAAVLGKTFEFGLLAAFTGSPEDKLLDALDEALTAQLVRPEGEEVFGFTHDKIREVLYEELNPIRRRRLHQRLAESLEQLYPPAASGLPVQDLAHHFLHGGDLKKGLHYAVLAAENADGLYAYDEALRYYALASECGQALDLPLHLIEIEEAAGDLQTRRGLFYLAAERYGLALEHLAALKEEAGQPETEAEKQREMRAVLKNKIATAYAQVGDERGYQLLQEAQQDLNPDTQLLELANNLSMQGRYLHYHGLHSKSITFLHQARELAEPANLPLPLTYIYAYLSGAYQHLALIDQSMQWARACVELGERENYPFATALGYEFLAEDLFFLARWEEGIACARKDQEIGERIGSLDRISWAGFSESNNLFGQGRLKESLALVESRFPLTEQTGDRRLVVWLYGLQSMILSDLGEREAALECARRAVETADELRQVILQCWSRFALVYELIKEERWEEAIALSQAQIELYQPLENRVAMLFTAMLYPRALSGAGRAREALDFIQSFLASAGELQIDFYAAIIQRVQGEVLAALGQNEQARAVLDQASAALQAQDSRIELARALQTRGRLLRELGETALAQGDLEQAARLFEQCGVPADRAV